MDEVIERKWWGLKIDGTVQYATQWYGKPDEQTFHLVFGIAITPSSQYEIVEVGIISAEFINKFPTFNILNPSTISF